MPEVAAAGPREDRRTSRCVGRDLLCARLLQSGLQQARPLFAELDPGAAPLPRSVALEERFAIAAEVCSASTLPGSPISRPRVSAQPPPGVARASARPGFRCTITPPCYALLAPRRQANFAAWLPLGTRARWSLALPLLICTGRGVVFEHTIRWLIALRWTVVPRATVAASDSV